MMETLRHLSSSTNTTTPFLKPPHFHPKKTLLSSKSTSLISLPPTKPITKTSTSTSKTATTTTIIKSNSEFQDKLLYLDSLGIDFFSLLSSHPPIVSVSTHSIKSTISILNSVGLTAPDLRRAISMCPQILTAPPSSLVPVFTFLLRECHVDGRHLRHVIHRRPRLLTCSVDSRLRPALYFLQGTVGICRVAKLTHLLSCSVESNFIPRIDCLRSLGFSYEDAIVMFRRFPSLFCYSVKDNIEVKFHYFVGEMGRELRELKEFPHCFSFSLENRIKPRHRECVDRGVRLSLPLMLKSSEDRFRDRLEVCSSSSMPVRTSPLSCTNYDHLFDV